jgi:hypothetical protein
MVAHGCGFGTAARVCTTDEQCHSAMLIDGRCEPAGLCSFADTTCDSGRRYGGLAGDQSGDCVGGGTNPIIDAAIGVAVDTPPPDAQVCFGTTTLVKICLEAAPTQPLVISTKTQIDTGDTTMCARTTSGADNYCVLAGTDINITARLRGVGPKPLVLIASGTITSSAAGEIDVGSHRVRDQGEPEAGAGRSAQGCDPSTPPAVGGGGAGGSFLGKGGNGGHVAGGIVDAVAAAVVNTVTELRGGCPGQDGQGTFPGVGGFGGGAVFLIAGTSITFAGTINAAGESGDGGHANVSGGGGGGAGGMIGVDAPMISVGLLLANGGGGGEGSRDGNGSDDDGAAGSDPINIIAAPGGFFGNAQGGNGGAGSAGMAGGPGIAGDPGIFSNTGGRRGAGGGGGGGAGIIKVPATATLTTDISPAGTP